jgi:hypothetical protein
VREWVVATASNAAAQALLITICADGEPLFASRTPRGVEVTVKGEAAKDRSFISSDLQARGKTEWHST